MFDGSQHLIMYEYKDSLVLDARADTFIHSFLLRRGENMGLAALVTASSDAPTANMFGRSVFLDF